METVHTGSIYYHFWGRLLRPRFDNPEYNNDFAVWAYHGLNDAPLAERLSIIDPTDFSDLESLRKQLLEVIEERLDEIEHVPWSKADQQFNFIRSQIVVFDTRRVIREPSELASAIPNVSAGSIFYHFIDSRRRTTESIDDFRTWLHSFGSPYADLTEQLGDLDPYFVSLTELRAQLASLFANYFGGKS